MGSGLSDIALTIGQSAKGSDAEVANIIEFCESQWGVNLHLFPVQRVILKAHYGIELDTKTIFKVAKSWQLKEYWHFNEKQYLEYLFNEGRSNIKEVDHDRPELVLVIGRRSGKCVREGTLVLTSNGIFPIEQLGDPAGPEVQDCQVGVAQEGSRKSQSAYFYNGGTRQTIRVQTHCGYKVEGTPNHRVKVLSENGLIVWKYLEDIQTGDVVCLHRGTDLWATEEVDCTLYHNTLGLKDLRFPDTLDERWGLLLGYLVGDGLWNYRDRVEVTVEHDETWEAMKSLFTELFGSYWVAMDKRTSNTGAIKFSSVGMRQFLHDIGYCLGVERDAKMVPWSILRSPSVVVQAFLRGLFETDGGMEAAGKVVSFSTASRRLADEVQVLLLNMGMVSRVRERIIKGKSYWVLTIRGLRSRRVFAEKIGFDSHKKMGPLLAALDSSREGGDTESIPHQKKWSSRLLNSIPKAKHGDGWKRSNLREVFGNIIKPSSKEDLTYSRLGGVVPLAQELGGDEETVKHFKHLMEMDYFFDVVNEVSTGECRVFDLNVPEGESFVANGFVNHNTYLAAAVGAYETYKLLLKGNPQGYYGIPPGKEIGIISVATDKDQAGILYRDVSAYFSACGFFAPYTANNTQTYARFQTPEDIKHSGRYCDNPGARASIRVSFRSCIAKGLRGPGNMIIILDELAHFTDGTQQSSAQAVYDAITPSTATFSQKDPRDSTVPIGVVEGRILSISSPLGRQGQFYKLYQMAMAGGRASQDMLSIQAPSWEVNPTIPASYFESKYIKDPVVFFTEFGGEFSDRTRGWIEREDDLIGCVDPAHRPMTQAPAKRPHFVGIDLGLVGDGTAIAIGHIEMIEGESKIVLDVVDHIKAGEGDYEDVDRLDFDDVAQWVFNYSRRFYMSEGLFDQWSGIAFEQALAKKGLQQLKSQHFTKNLTSEIFRNFKDMMWDKRLVLYDWPIPQNSTESHCAYIQELLELQAQYHTKYVTTVAAPNVDGKHDDRSDAIVRMVWLASQNLGNQRYITGTHMGRAAAAQGARSGRIAMRKARLKARQMGTSPDRQPSRLVRGRIRGRR